jgi:hypothetical protein
MSSTTTTHSPLLVSILLASGMAASSSFATMPMPLAAVRASSALVFGSLADPEAAEMSGLAFADAEVVKALRLVEAGKAGEAVGGLTKLIDSEELATTPRADELRLAVCMIRVRTGEASKVKDDLQRMASSVPAKGGAAVPTASIARVLQKAADPKVLGKAGDVTQRDAWLKLLGTVRAECATAFEKSSDELVKALKSENLGAIKSSAAKSDPAFADLAAITHDSTETENVAVARAAEMRAPLENFGAKGTEQSANIDKLRTEWREIGEKRRAARDNGGKPQDFIAPQKAKAAEVDAARAEYDAWVDAAQPAFAHYNQVQQQFGKAIPKLSVSVPRK